ncbi:GPR1/FUN34/yaaH family-domain-containing protein [Aspergillus keveii]|uniref:GPR1/FUN34/yaaH family-domain-containing protein n=1 Tax=Aspergillus keveii TaxID=714993 RepID=A0ABR4FLA1_9EURO
MDTAANDIEAVQGQKLSKHHLANPGPLGFGAFATTLMTLSLSMMGLRAVSNQTVFIANLCFLAGLGLLISAQWEMVKGNTFNYTVLAAFGFYYGGYGVLLMPPLAVVDSYGGRTTEYYNAFGLKVWSILNFFFFVASLPTNMINVIIYSALELSYIFNCMGNFFMANTDVTTGTTLVKVAGAFGFTSSLAGFYMLCHDLCQQTLPFNIPLFETSRLFSRPRYGVKSM